MISVRNVSVDFLQYTNQSASLKDAFIKFIVNFGRAYLEVEKFTVLRNINFTLEDGDRLAIIGKNGAGKTSLLKTICGIYKPQLGSIIVEGKLSSLVEIGAGINPELTGRENIYIAGLFMGFSKQQIMAKEQEIIEFSGIGDFIDTPMKSYSTGMGMRLSFSIVTIINPDILIVDELFAGGDIGFIDKAKAKIDEIISNSRIFITAPHDMAYVRSMCNKVLYLKDRKAEYFGNDIEKAITMYQQDVLNK